MTMVLGKTFLKKVVTALHVLFLKKTYQDSSELSIYVLELKQKDGNCIILEILPWSQINIFLDHKSVLYAFVKSSLLQEEIQTE